MIPERAVVRAPMRPKESEKRTTQAYYTVLHLTPLYTMTETETMLEICRLLMVGLFFFLIFKNKKPVWSVLHFLVYNISII